MTPAGALDPVSAPLTYPGIAPDDPFVLVTGSGVILVHPSETAQLGQWRVQPSTGAHGVPLDEFLRAHQAVPMTSRIPVLAVGSNAAPAQLRRKLATTNRPTMVPVTAVTVYGLAVGVSAHVSKAGYVPATPVPDPSATSPLWVTWLAADEITMMDETEPNYRRVIVPDVCAVELKPGQPVTGCWVYISRHGFLTESSGEPRRLTGQPDLIASLLADVPALVDLAGTSPAEWIQRTRDERVRDEIKRRFRLAGITRATDLYR